MTGRHTKVRQDIQVLRGFAVLVVLIYHARLGIFRQGYLGVDVFFVLSGFLITRLVKEGLERRDFQFAEFYFRRAKRLLPAAYSVFFVTAIVAPFLLTSNELQDFRGQMIGAVTFTANFVLWRQSGYFGGAAAVKPFLHVWSLSLEEQYYFVLPTAMVLCPRRFWKVLFVILILSSFVLCLFMANKTAATFYLLPTRAWEMAMGSAGALFVVNKESMRTAFWPAMIALVLLPAFKLIAIHPGPDAFIVCLATLAIILREHPFLSRGVLMRAMARVGDVSYSLYLVHWPLYAFLNNVYMGGRSSGPPVVVRLSLAAVAVLLAFLLNKYIEEPIREKKIRFSLRITIAALAASVILVLIAVVSSRPFHKGSDLVDRRANQGMDSTCDFRSDFLPLPKCSTSLSPRILVWGDSFAMHLVPGILHSTAVEPAIAQATRGECGPLVGIAPMEKVFTTGADASWAKRCIAFNDSVIQYLERSPSVEIVVLSSPFGQYVDSRGYVILAKRDLPMSYVMRDASVSEALAGLKKTLDKVRSLGKKVVIVAPPPQADFDVGRCLERVDSHMPTWGIPDHCKILKGAYEKENEAVLELLSKIPATLDVDVIDFKPYLCGSDFCETDLDGTALYTDTGHLSRAGSILLAKKTMLLQKINSEAR